MEEEFRKYVDKYNFNDTNINRKYYHSLRVKDLCILIGKSLNVDDNELELLSVSGLLHDYGRFYQWSKYHTFSDRESIDHADYAAKELFDNNKIKDFYKKSENYDLIKNAIKYHNKYSVPKLDNMHIKICDILRDADKLDILYIFASKTMLLGEEGEITDTVKDTFDSEKIINNKDITTPSNHAIAMIALVFDIKYEYSFKHIKKFSLLEKMYENMKNKEKFKYYYDKAIKYVEDRCNN